MSHATSLLYYVHAIILRNKWFSSCGTSGKLTLYVYIHIYIYVYLFIYLFIYLRSWGPGTFSELSRSVQVPKREWGAESNGKLPHLFIPSETATLAPEFAVDRTEEEEKVGSKVRLGRVRPDGQRPSQCYLCMEAVPWLLNTPSPRRGASGYA